MPETAQNGTNLDIFSSLKHELLDLTIKPGEQILESAVCERFGSSRPPVRAAFQRLADLGLVDILPYKGVYASLLDLDYIHQMIHMRTKVEGQILVDFINSKPDAFLLEELEHNIRKQQIYISQNDVNINEFYSLDSEMHAFWFAACKCSGIWNLIQQQEIHYTRFRMLDFVATQKYEQIVGNHLELLEEIKAGRTESIDLILGKHLNGGLRRMGEKVLKEYGQYFKPPQDQAFWMEYTKQYFS
ncbi:MAG: GntR family transcriptional regulator [Sphaerochaeta sp.]|jgi:DNA-binding GntR family transcriptional regulator|uniref:GntR family transcriptional regulator n=1 Tax=Sphaerochaeta sp. TaxID=1972642 RepID=UPI001DB0A194|nr:GntR family transcriptional regulator [uncultured Sphaerochaeta sp.]MDD3929871.1 GntR family transcriptional regulator [Sphaerochaeta sp.]NCC13433.1 GntR family transcriptional regulator [Spirochaetia bacterium]NCC90739.1 GntR family transcriptional regulator [Spirochaetia bacterium]